MDSVSFTVDRRDHDLITQIAARAVGMFGRDLRADRMHFEMDVTAVHANGNPLRLTALLNADDGNFAHDICGIYCHLNRETGELENCFSPRFSA